MSRGRGKNNRGDVGLGRVVDSAIEYGISAIIKHRPRFRNIRGVITEYVDREKLEDRANEMYMELAKKGGLDQSDVTRIHRDLSNYVASGEAFDEEGQRIVLNKGLEERANKKGLLNYFSRKGAKNELEGIKTIDKIIGAYGRVHQALEEGGGYGMSELQKPLDYLNRAGFLSVALEMLKEDGLDEVTYARINKNLTEGMKKSRGEAIGGLEKYSLYEPHQKVAAAVLGVSGVGLLLMFGNGMTGGVIGATDNNIVAAILGGMFIVSSLVLFFKKF